MQVAVAVDFLDVELIEQEKGNALRFHAFDDDDLDAKPPLFFGQVDQRPGETKV